MPVALEAFNRLMPTPNQIALKKRDDVNVGAADLIKFEPEQPITEKGLRLNINVAIQYIGAWLAGQGAVPIFNLMEDAATAEISRSQVWQWIRSPKGKLDDGRKVTKEMVAAMIPEEMRKIRGLLGDAFGSRQVRRCGEDLRRPRQQRHFRGVPDAAGIRADRLSAADPEAKLPRDRSEGVSGGGGGRGMQGKMGVGEGSNCRGKMEEA